MILGILSLFLSMQIPLDPVDPSLEWKTKHSEHFKIHYPTDLEDVAARLSEVVEPIHAKLTTQFSWTPSGPVHVILLNNTDSANGFSTPLPYNSIYLNIAPPDAGSSLDYYDEWLTTLFTHEYTHSIHVDMAHGINKFLRLLFGRSVVPNAAQPQWLLEGFAVYNESLHSTAGRGRSSFVDMYMRTASLEDKFLPISRATYWNDIYPFGNAAYWYGIGFYQYIAKTYGGEKWVEFAHSNASSIIPGWFNFKTRDIFGKSFSRLWEEWRLHEKQRWTAETSKYQSRLQTKTLSKKNWRAAGQGCWIEDKFYSSVQDHEDKVRLVRWEWKPENLEPTEEILEKTFSAGDLHCYQDALYYSKISPSSRFNSYSDLWRYDLKEKKSQRLSFNQRLRDVFIKDDWVYAVRTARMKSEILRFRLPEVFISGDVEARKKFKASEHPLETEIIFAAENFATLSQPQISPDGSRLLFSMFKETESRDLYILNLKNKKLERLTQDEFLEYSPQWISNSEVLFTADHFQPGTNIKVFNVFQLHVETKMLQRVTDTWTGIYWPSFSNSQLMLGHLNSEGFQLEKLPLQSLDRQLLSQQNLSPKIPPVLEGPLPVLAPVRTTEYQMGTSLLPRYLIPFGYYTEDDSLGGLLTGSNDPLGFHRWLGFVYFVEKPRRPGGAVSYSYLGFGRFSWNTSLSAGVSNFGQVLLAHQDGQLYRLAEDYYERTYRASTGFSYRLWGENGPQPFYLSHDISFSDRRPLKKVNEAALRDPILFRGKQVQSFPDVGQQFSLSTTAIWSSGFSREIQGIAPSGGRSLRLELEYSPKLMGTEFHTLTSSLTYKEYIEFLRFHSVGVFWTAGVQWLDHLYQSSFRLGGSSGEGPLNSFNRQTVPLRGLPASFLRGEGVTAGSLEYRFPLLRHVPGWGTAPVWFKNFHAVLFSDAGQSFQIKDEATAIDIEPESFSFKRFTWSAGAELRSDASIYFGPPVTFRLGYGYVIYLEGQRADKPRFDEIYFRVGSSF